MAIDVTYLRTLAPIIGFVLISVFCFLCFYLGYTRWHIIKRFAYGIFNRKPAYMITESGVKVRYFNFSKYNELPFDRDTYHDCQIFIGNWANPWHVDLQAIAEEYSEYDRNKHVITGKHVIPSQKYKTYMKQDVLNQIFSATGFDAQKILWLLYGTVALLIILIFIVIGVSA